jgi:serralysin
MPLGTWTLDQVFNQLNSGNKWGNLTITFSFPTSSNSITTNSGEAPGFSAMNAAQQNASRLAFWLWDDLIAPDFLEVAAGQNFSSTDLELAITTSVELGAGWARFPNNGSIWFSGTYDPVVNPKVGGYGF